MSRASWRFVMVCVAVAVWALVSGALSAFVTPLLGMPTGILGGLCVGFLGAMWVDKARQLESRL